LDNKQYFALAALMTILAIAIYYGFKRKQKSGIPAYNFYTGLLARSNEGHAPFSVSVYGDSISVPSQLGAVLQLKLGVAFAFQNFAVAGTRLTQWLLAIPGMGFNLLPIKEQIAADSSSVLVCRYGINDALQNADLNLFKQMLITFVETTRDRNKIPVLVGLTKMSSPQPDAQMKRAIFNNAIYEIACRYVVHFIDLDVVAFDPQMDTPDFLHPSAQYYERIDDHLANQLIERHIFIPV